MCWNETRPADDHEHHQHQDQEPLAESELNDVMNHDRVLPLGSVLQRIRELQEQAAVADNFVARRKPLQNLRFAVLALADLHRAPAELVRCRLAT